MDNPQRKFEKSSSVLNFQIWTCTEKWISKKKDLLPHIFPRQRCADGGGLRRSGGWWLLASAAASAALFSAAFVLLSQKLSSISQIYFLPLRPSLSDFLFLFCSRLSLSISSSSFHPKPPLWSLSFSFLSSSRMAKPSKNLISKALSKSHLTAFPRSSDHLQLPALTDEGQVERSNGVK